MFKERLLPRFRNLVLVLMRHSFREVVDVTMIVDKNYLTTQSRIQEQSQPSSSTYPHIASDNRP